MREAIHHTHQPTPEASGTCDAVAVESARASARANRRRQMEGISAFLLALGGARAWLTLLFAAPAIPTTVDLGLPLGLHQIFDVVFCIFMLSVALNSQKSAPLCRASWVRPVILGGMLGASVLCCGASVLGPSASGLAIAGALVGGLGFAAFLLTWAEVMSGLSL
ncbi:MAG: hypothetical protein PUD02_05970, partial [Eggerthellales bacterium]|nr:hypothetical protein [Eggerthellales bacterium]